MNRPGILWPVRHSKSSCTAPITVTSLIMAALSFMAALISASPQTASAADPTINGKVLFEKEWSYNKPATEPQNVPNPRGRRGSARQRIEGDGLGPMFNARSCQACHVDGGGAGVEHNVTLLALDPRSPLFDREQVEDDAGKKALVDLYPTLLAPQGNAVTEVVLHEASSRPFYDPIRAAVGNYVEDLPDHWFVSKKRTIDAIADQPVVAGRMGPIDYYMSQRNSPALYGLGLIDSIDRQQRMAIANRQARRTNGRIRGLLGAGVFGWRAQTPNLETFVRGACAGELGLQVPLTPQPPDAADDTYQSPGMDLNEPEVRQLIAYIRSLPRPVEGALPEHAEAAKQGKRLFFKIGCADCHVEDIIPATGVYSDFLLHDMGSRLQAPTPASPNPSARIPRRPLRHFANTHSRTVPAMGLNLPSGLQLSSAYTGGAGRLSQPIPIPYERPLEPTFPRGENSGGEHPLPLQNGQLTWDDLQRYWKTTPLWGVADSAPYLHDGRAKTLDNAIRWHGGEAKEAASKYRKLASEERAKVIEFLASLRAPKNAPRQVAKRSVTPVELPEKLVTTEELDAALEVFSQ